VDAGPSLSLAVEALEATLDGTCFPVRQFADPSSLGIAIGISCWPRDAVRVDVVADVAISRMAPP